MWSPHQQPEPVEKIRKAQWTVENTRQTQAVVNGLVKVRAALRFVSSTGNQSEAQRAIEQAIARFQQLDPKVTP